MNTVQQQWEAFASLVIAKDAPPIQRREMKRAFYAGAQALLAITYNLGGEDEDAGIQTLMSLDAELQMFALDIAEGRA